MKDNRVSNTSPLCIKSNAWRIVKHALNGACLVGLLLQAGCSEFMIRKLPGDNEVSKREEQRKPLDPDEIEKLPAIEVRSFELNVIRHTRSASVYLFEVTQGEIPAPGRIVLLKKDKTPVMAFRALKAYPEKRQFAGRKLRVYEGYSELNSGEAYLAIEKLSDVSSFGTTQDDRAELNELEGIDKPTGTSPDTGAATGQDAGDTNGTGAPLDESTQAPTQEEIDRELGPLLDYDPELDSESSPPPNGAVDSTNEKGISAEFTPEGPLEPELDETGMSVEEVTPLQPNPHSMTGSFGFFRNGEGSSFPAGGARVSFRLNKLLFFSKPLLQDELSAEVGLFLYKAIFTQNDVFTVFPLIFTGRYTVHTSEDLSLFLYGGVMKNIAIPAGTVYTIETYNSLVALIHAVGAGLLFRIGPSWEARVDIGYDMLGLGLVIGF